MEISLTPEQRKGINEKINSFSFPEKFKNDKSLFPLYVSNLFQILEAETLGGNKGYIEVLRNNNHQLIRPFIENRSF